MPTAGETRPAPRPDTIDGRALVEEIATKWEKEGVNPAWVKIIREPRTWMRLSPSDQPAIVKLAKDLPPGGISALRKQAIRLIRDTPLWQKLLDDRQRANHEPKISRSTLHRRLAAQTFGRKNSSPDKTTRVMYLLVNASMVSDAVKTRGPHTWDALQALGIDPAQAWRWQWRNQPGSMWP